MSNLTGRVALVTGGGRGTGATTARRLADDGAAVAVLDLREEDTADKDAVAAVLPLRRTGMPSDIAGVVSFLVGDDSAYVTGQTLYVDGGPH